MGEISTMKHFQFYSSVQCLVKTPPSSFLCCPVKLESYHAPPESLKNLFLNVEVYHSS